MRRRIWAIFAAVMMSGCYHVTVVTAAPEAPASIDKAFQLSFVAGLVPPPAIQADEEGCSNGVAKVETWRSFVNILVSSLSSSLVTPMSVSVTCAASLPLPDASTPSENGELPSAVGAEGAAEAAEIGEPGAGG